MVLSNEILTALAFVLGLVTLFGAGIVMMRGQLAGPTVPLAVVDSDSYRRAQLRVAEAIECDELAAAEAGIAAMCGWLHQEVRTGPERNRVLYARLLEYWELVGAELPDHVKGGTS